MKPRWTRQTDKRDNKARTVSYRCRSTKITSLCSEGSPLIGCPIGSWCCHASMSSVASLRYFISSLSPSGSPHVRECVALAAACTARPKEPMPSLTWPSALCSFTIRRVRSLCGQAYFDFRSFTFDFIRSVQRLCLLRHRLPHELHVGCKLPWKPRGLPNSRKFFGCCGQIIARAIQIVL